jgi:hypothetical protein
MKWLQKILLGIAVIALVLAVHLALPVAMCVQSFPYACAYLWHGVQLLSPFHSPLNTYPFGWHP